MNVDSRNGVCNTVNNYINGPGPNREAASIPLQNQNGNNDQAQNADQVQAGMPGHPAHNSNPPAAAQNDDQHLVPHPPQVIENVAQEEAAPHSKWTKMWMVLLIVGVSSLVVVPGLVLGVVMRQIPWGIALSGAIATMVSFFAGLYYYHNK